MSKNDPLPSYEDIISGGASDGQQILDQLTLVRNRHIRSVIDEDIYPFVEKHALYGIAKTTVALVPSDIALPQSEPTKSEFAFDNVERVIEFIGFSSDEDFKHVQLEGPLNRLEFWRQRDIVLALERSLQEKLNVQLPYRTPDLQPVSPPKPIKKGLFGRKSSSTTSGASNNGVAKKDEFGQLMVKVDLEDVCFRTVSPFGLYETMTKQAIIVRVNVRV